MSAKPAQPNQTLCADVIEKVMARRGIEGAIYVQSVQIIDNNTVVVVNDGTKIGVGEVECSEKDTYDVDFGMTRATTRAIDALIAKYKKANQL